MTIGIIGYGNIAKLIITNLIKNRIISEDELIVSNRNLHKLDSLKEEYPLIKVTDDNKYLSENSDKIIISVQSQELLNVLSEIEPYLNNKYIIHTCAGINFDDIADVYDGPVSLVIPTMASTFTQKDNPQKGVSLIVHNDKVNFLDSSHTEILFNEFSYVKILPDEEDIEIATILTSCAPAYISLLSEKISSIASSNSNLTKDESTYLILKTLIGTSEVLNSEIISSKELSSKVCTEGGITEKGYDYLDLELDKDLNELFKILISSYKK